MSYNYIRGMKMLALSSLAHLERCQPIVQSHSDGFHVVAGDEQSQLVQFLRIAKLYLKREK